MASALHSIVPVRKLGSLIGVVVAHLILLGCYNPDVRDCTVQCTMPTDCTGGQECNEGWCAAPGKKCNKDGLVVDAAALTVDASTLCLQGCTNGTCVDGVCVIDCSGPYTCQNDVTCPANLPCRVVCGYHSCAHHIVCGLASSCEVQCLGDYSCADEIQCNTHRCDVDCVGSFSCKRRTKCVEACACDVSCTGSGSCVEASECPSLSCKLGNGCTDQLAGCNMCP